MVVAVDGPAGSGKSSVSKEVSRRLGFRYIDSGAVYRAITWFVLRECGSVEIEGSLIDRIKGIDIQQEFASAGTVRTWVNGIDVSTDIRTEIIAKNIGVISDDPEIRHFVNALLREWSRSGSVIMDGRDIGTVVFPDADMKIYLDASVDVRTRRRFLEYRDMGKTVDESEVKKQIIQRDHEDTDRSFGGLRRAEGSIYIDTSGMGRGEVVNTMIKLITGD